MSRVRRLLKRGLLSINWIYNQLRPGMRPQQSSPAIDYYYCGPARAIRPSLSCVVFRLKPIETIVVAVSVSIKRRRTRNRDKRRAMRSQVISITGSFPASK